ncbi:hypothetical protein ACH0BF_01400 [Pseudobacillus sp. 179-B 2D1 NHS]|uniref:hypothetical protein n=1 Tax=Pseudobacillus sp. 179-B 2D1 NHS TaxID=3374292 RepID=UPI00387A4140
MILTPYKNAYGIAKEVHNLIHDRKEYFLKPEQPLNTNQSLWWIGLKSYKWPAYSHGKYVFFNREKGGKNIVFCGLHIERGLSKETDEKSAYLLSNEWAWHKFYNDWKEGKIQEKLHLIEKFAGHSFIHIDVHSDVTARQNQKKYDKLVYLQRNTTVQANNSINAGLLPLGHEYNDPTNAFNILLSEKNPNLPFSWIDCYVGFYVGFEAGGAENAYDVWEKGLYVFDEYLK